MWAYARHDSTAVDEDYEIALHKGSTPTFALRILQVQMEPSVGNHDNLILEAGTNREEGDAKTENAQNVFQMCWALFDLYRDIVPKQIEHLVVMFGCLVHQIL